MSSSPYGLRPRSSQICNLTGICQVSIPFSDTANATVLDLGFVGF